MIAETGGLDYGEKKKIKSLAVKLQEGGGLLTEKLFYVGFYFSELVYQSGVFLLLWSLG